MPTFYFWHMVKIFTSLFFILSPYFNYADFIFQLYFNWFQLYHMLFLLLFKFFLHTRVLIIVMKKKIISTYYLINIGSIYHYLSYVSNFIKFWWIVMEKVELEAGKKLVFFHFSATHCKNWDRALQGLNSSNSPLHWWLLPHQVWSDLDDPGLSCALRKCWEMRGKKTWTEFPLTMAKLTKKKTQLFSTTPLLNTLPLLIVISTKGKWCYYWWWCWREWVKRVKIL